MKNKLLIQILSNKYYKMLSIKSILVICLLCITIIFLYLIPGSNLKESFTTNSCKIYFINLDENKDRWEKLSPELQQKITRFPAINGKKLDKDQLIKDGIISEENNLRMGQIGCALSHITILKHIQQQDEPYGLILEDDVTIPPNFSVESLKLPDDFDICFLGGCNIKGEKVSENWIRPTSKNGAFNLCWHAVLVNKKNVQKVIDLLTPLRRPIDSQIRTEYDKLKVFYHYPNLISQNKSLRSTRRDIDGLPQSKYWQKHHLDVTID
jgi:GR25 family glycosyltransferase involved in LPS biosynthesis